MSNFQSDNRLFVSVFLTFSAIGQKKGPNDLIADYIYRLYLQPQYVQGMPLKKRS